MTPQVQIVCFRSCGPHYFIAVKAFSKKKKKKETGCYYYEGYCWNSNGALGREWVSYWSLEAHVYNALVVQISCIYAAVSQVKRLDTLGVFAKIELLVSSD